MVGTKFSTPVQSITKTFDFAPHIADLSKGFVGREWVFDEINRWLADPAGAAFLIITGEPGVGKSAIAARFTQVSQVSAHHFCIARDAETLDPIRFSKSLSQQLRAVEGFDLSLLKTTKQIKLDISLDIQANYGQVIPVLIKNLVVEARSGIEAFIHAVLQPLKDLCASDFNKQVVILVDALDEAQQSTGAETILDLLANTGPLPRQVRLVLTCRPENAVLRHFESRQIPHFGIDASGPENLADVHRYVRAQLDASEALRTRVKDQKMSEELFAERITTASEGNFLYAVYVLPAIAAGAQSFDRLEMLPAGLKNVYREFLSTRKGLDAVNSQPLLGTLAAARQPLSHEQLARFSNLNAQEVNTILVPIQQFLEPTLWTQKQYQFYHQSIIDFLCDRDRSDENPWIDIVSAHQKIADYYHKNSEASNPLDWNRMDEYGLRYLIAHQTKIAEAEPAEEERVRQLIGLATDFRFVRARIGLLGLTAIELETSALRRLQIDVWSKIRLGLTEVGLMFGILTPRPIMQSLPEELFEEKETVLYRQTLAIKAPAERVFRHAQELSASRLHEQLLPSEPKTDVLAEGRYVERVYNAYFVSPSVDLPGSKFVSRTQDIHDLSKLYYRFRTGIQLPIWEADPKVGVLRLKVTLSPNSSNETQVTQQTSLVPSTLLVKVNEQDPTLLKDPLAPLQLSHFLLDLKSLAEAPSDIGENLLSDRLRQPTLLQLGIRILIPVMALIGGWTGRGWWPVFGYLPLWLAVEFGSEAKKAAAIEKEFGIYMPRARGWRTLFWVSLSLLAVEIMVLLWIAWQNGLLQRLLNLATS
jgi:hypothetical protein